MLNLEQLHPEQLRPLRRTEYDRLVELGAFDEDEHVELLSGMLVAMSPLGPDHAAVISWLTQELVHALRRRAEVRVQLPLALSDDSEPEPDLTVVPPGDYRAAHPTHAWLVVEVANATLRKDRLIKARLYAEAGIPEYWIVNLADQVLLVHRQPVSGAYTSVTEHRAGRAHLAKFPDVAIDVAALW
ncbi:MAG: Uma2 family endonuclease [Myxococcota bacterium]